jgi:hypothetical protein
MMESVVSDQKSHGLQLREPKAQGEMPARNSACAIGLGNTGINPLFSDK